MVRAEVERILANIDMSKSTCYTEDSEIAETTSPISGVRGLAAHLGCCADTAQRILNSGILQKQGIAYRVGSRWKVNGAKLDKLISENPEIFNSRRKH